MSVLDEITRLETAKSNIEKAIEYCGVNVPNTEKISTYASYIRQIPSAVFSELNVDKINDVDIFIRNIKQTNGKIEATAGGLVSSSQSGLAPKIGTFAASTISTQKDEWVLTSTKGEDTPTWRKLPINAFNNSDTKVTQTITTTNANYRVLFSANANNTTETTTTRKSAKLLYNPFTETLTTKNFAGTALQATKLTSSAGSATIPIYFSNGKPVACTPASIFSDLSNDGNNISMTVAGKNRKLTVAYASNADKVDGYSSESFAIWRGDANTDSTISDVTSTSTSDFFEKINATSKLFNSRFGAMRGSYYYMGNTQLNTGVGILDMAGTAVLNLGSETDTNDTYKSLLFLDQRGRLWSYTANDPDIKQWSRYAKTTDIKDPVNYYWANIKVSDTSNDYTTPSFGKVTICDKVNSRLVLKTANANEQAYLAAYNTGGQYGADIVLHSGSAMVLGAGKSAASMYSINADSLQGSKNLYLTADGSIKIFTNCNSINNRKQVVHFNTSGYAIFGSYINIGGHEKNESSPTYVWGSNSSDNFLRSYKTSSLLVNYANSAGTASRLKQLNYPNNNINTDLTSEIGLRFYTVPSTVNGSAGKAGNEYGFDVSNNANGILDCNVHSSKFSGQIGISSNKNLYYRFIFAGNYTNAQWVKLLTSDNYSSYALPLTGGTITGNIILKGSTSENMTYGGNVHPYIRFDNPDSSQNISLIFTDYNSYRSPAGIKLVGNQGDEWFEATNIYATTFYGSLSGNATSATIARSLGTDDSMKLYAQLNNEINFGGTNSSNTIYFGYREKDSKPIPTNFVFGGVNGSATLKANGFSKKDSSNDYMLLGGGGHKALIDCTIPVGTIVMLGGSEIPTGWLLCDGTSVSRETYNALFDAIGTTYGDGDGSTTFGLPNFKRRFPLGVDSGSWECGKESYYTSIGKTGGEYQHVLSISEMPAHGHSFTAHRTYDREDDTGADVNNAQGIRLSTGYTNSAGGNQPHNNIPPYLAVNFIIKY